MSWFERRLPRVALAAGLMLLAGCGFHPLYAQHDETGFDGELAAIKVDNIPDRLGQELTESLRDNLNPSSAKVAPRYVLDVELDAKHNDVGILVNATASRSQVTAIARFELKDARSNAVLLRATSRSITSFDVLTDDYATLVAQQSAEERLLRDLSDDIRTRLALFIKRQRDASKS